jgi:hypothetical protein
MQNEGGLPPQSAFGAASVGLVVTEKSMTKKWTTKKMTEGK